MTLSLKTSLPFLCLLMGTLPATAEMLPGSSAALNPQSLISGNMLISGFGGLTKFEALGEFTVLWGKDQVQVQIAGVLVPIALSAGATSSAAPSIYGQVPFVVVAGGEYYFKPVTSSQGAGLLFTIANAPSWARLDPDTGELTGMPGVEDIGTYSDIFISVTSTAGTASTEPFSITVIPDDKSRVVLTWVAPTTNEDGSALVDLAGYRVAYGASINLMQSFIDIPGPGSLTVEVEDLPAGPWYFAVQAINTSGISSVWSPIVSTVL